MGKLAVRTCATLLVLGLVGSGSTIAYADPGAEGDAPGLVVQEPENVEDGAPIEDEGGNTDESDSTESVPEAPVDPEIEGDLGEEDNVDDNQAPSVDGDPAGDELAPGVPSRSGINFTFGKVGLLTLPAGDNVRDVVNVNVQADGPTMANVRVADFAGNDLAYLGSVEFTDAQLVATVPVPVQGLQAGSLQLIIESADGMSSNSVALVVGSGKPKAVSLSLSRSTVETWKSSSIKSTTATVSAKDETGQTVPFTGKVVAKVGGKSVTRNLLSTNGKSAKADVAGSGLGLGKGSVVATVKGSGASTSSKAVTLQVRDVSVKTVKVSRSVATVYPVKDGYIDSVKFKVAASTSTGKAVKSTGSVKVTRAGKTVKSWKLKSSKSWSASWNGKVGSKIVPGTYKVVVTLKGPQGPAKSSSIKVKVAPDKLVTKTSTKTIKATSGFTRYANYDLYDEGYCEILYGDLSCIGFDAYYGDSLSLFAYGAHSLPREMRNSAKYGGAKVRATLDTTFSSGIALWGYGTNDRNGKFVEMSEGYSSPGWVSVPKGDKQVVFSAGLGEYSFFSASTVKIEYRYKVLTK